MKNPNGYGSVVKLSGKRRKPYAVRKTKGFDEIGHPVYDIIGYFATREEGMIALALYNQSPFDVNRVKITFKELHSLWLEEKCCKLGKRNQIRLKTAMGHCEQLYDMKYREIRSYHMQRIIDNCNRGYSTQSSIKNLFGHLDRFAKDLEVITCKYSDSLTSDSVPETEKVPFSEIEVKKIWEMQYRDWVDSILVLLYTGLRISELLDIESENVDLSAGTIKGGMKTKAGKNRIVPIHSCIENIVRNRLNTGDKYLFSHKGRKCSYSLYMLLWNRIMKDAGMTHTPHECRHTFRTLIDSARANKRCIDLIMGHKSRDVGERVYTHKTIQELKEAIELIKI